MQARSIAAAVATLFAAGSALADTVTDWNIKSGEIVADAGAAMGRKVGELALQAHYGH